MNFNETNKLLDEIYKNLTKKELTNKLKAAGFIITDGPYGFITKEKYENITKGVEVNDKA